MDALRYCVSGGGCTELDDISLPYEPGDVAAGTFYEADVFGVTQRSTAWTGRVGSTLEPTMRGTLALGATLTPVAAQWTGGWGDDVSRLSLYVCRTEGGDDCVFSTGAVRAEHNGRYAFSVDSRAAKNDHVPASPADGATAILPSRTATVAVSAAAGPISSTAAGAPPIPAPKAPGGLAGHDAHDAEGQEAEGHPAQARVALGQAADGRLDHLRHALPGAAERRRRAPHGPALAVRERDGAADDRQRLQAAQEGAPARRRHRRRHAAEDRPRPRLAILAGGLRSLEGSLRDR